MQQTQDSQIPIKIFYSYSHKDIQYRNKLKTHLSVMRKENLISEMHDQDILPGKVWADEVNKYLKTADVILLLISPDFMDSDYCYSMEMQRAIKRCEDEDACIIIPIIIRPCEWKYSPLGKFQALPYKAKAVTSWSNRDEAFLDIVQGIRRVVNNLRKIRARDKATFKNVDSIPITKSSNREKNHSIKTTRLVQKRVEDRSIGKKTQGILNLIKNNFSFGEVKKRARGFFSLALLFLFTVLNIIALPYLIYWWANSLICILSIFFLGFLFLMGITNKNGVAAYSVTVAFFVIWTFIGFAGTNHITLPFYWLIVIILLLSLLQLVLFRPRGRKRRVQRIF